jgi:hypothetical protein
MSGFVLSATFAGGTDRRGPTGFARAARFGRGVPPASGAVEVRGWAMLEG